VNKLKSIDAIRYTNRQNVKSLADFILCTRVKNELSNWMKKSVIRGTPLLLHGIGGCGKSSLANTISQKLLRDVTDVYYCDFSDGSSSEQKKEIDKRMFNSSFHLFSASNELDKFLVLDEFHNLNKSQQDSFKQVLLEESCLAFKYRVIVVMNTDDNRQYREMISQPIQSRCHDVSFHLNDKEHNYVVKKFCKTYPNVDAELVDDYVPDIRRLLRYI